MSGKFMTKYSIIFLSLYCVSFLCFGVYDGYEDKTQKFKNVHELKLLEDGKFVGPCTATIISDYAILSAAHCFDAKDKTEVSLSKHKYKIKEIHTPSNYQEKSNTYYELISRLSILNLKSITPSWNAQDSEEWYFSQILLNSIHIDLAKNDIAILITEKKISKKLKRTKLNFDVPLEGVRVYAVGYGWLKNQQMKKKHPEVPHYRSEVITNAKSGTLGINSQTNIDKITTPGDSGGPLLLDSSHEQIGVLRGQVSFLTWNRSIYTPLSNHKEFILKILKH
jgi:V8-like Glu-specific endopeptidase